MKLRILLFIVSALLTTNAYSQQKIGSNNIGKISEIKLQGRLNVTYIPSEMNAIEINLYNSDISKLRWNIVDSTLNVSLKSGGNTDAYADINIWSSTPLSKLDLSEASFFSEDIIVSNMIELIVSSSSKLIANLKSIDIEVRASGGSTVNLSGESTYLEVYASESSRVDTRKMDIVSCEVEGSSSAEVYIDAEERLIATAKTGATIFYSGNPIITKLTTPKLTGLGAGIHKIKSSY